MTVEMSKGELRMLIQSLANCIATCKTRGERKAEPACRDCDAARKLRRRLQRQVLA